MTTLVIAGHNNDVAEESTFNAISAAFELGNEVHVLVPGFDCNSVVNELSKVRGVDRVIIANHPNFRHFLAEEVAPLIVKIANNYEHILMASNTTGKNLMPRVAALLDMAQISDIISIENNNTFRRPIYAGNIIATIRSRDKIKLITIRATSFASAERSGGIALIEEISTSDTYGLSNFVNESLSESCRPELTNARIIISGGRGMGNGKNFELIEKVADKLGAAIGASRAAVDSGFVPNDFQIGQTGKIVAPELYIAVGISGAIQHLAGMKDSKIIVAINKDEDAPIFQVADYGIVADLFEILPELEKAI